MLGIVLTVFLIWSKEDDTWELPQPGFLHTKDYSAAWVEKEAGTCAIFALLVLK